MSGTPGSAASQQQPTTRQFARTVGASGKTDQAEKRRVETCSVAAQVSSDETSERSLIVPPKKARMELQPRFDEAGQNNLYPPPKDKLDSNIDIANLASLPLLEEDDESQNEDIVTNVGMTGMNKEKEEHFVLPSPLNTNDESDTEKGKDNGVENDSDSDKFFANIKAKEEAQLQRKKEEQAASGVIGTGPQTALSSTAGMASGAYIAGVKRKVSHPYYTPEADGKVKVVNTTSPSSLDSEYMMATTPGSHFLDIEFKLYCPNTKALIYDTRGIPLRSDYATVASLLKQNGLDLENLSAALSGYSGDISASTGSSYPSIDSPRHKFTSMSSAISSIPRPSDASTLSRPSVAGSDYISKKPVAPLTRVISREDQFDPLINSTHLTANQTQSATRKINDQTTHSLNDNLLDINSNTNNSKLIVSNGSASEQEISLPTSATVTPKTTIIRSYKTDKTPQNISQILSTSSDLSPSTSSDSLKVRPSPTLHTTTLKDSAINSLSSSPEQTEGRSETRSESSQSAKKTASTKRRGRQESTDEYDPTKFLTETAKQAIADFKYDKFSEAATLWGSMGPGEFVFARWRDRVYYSGKITEKGSNDTWQIKFDDGMDDVASETHILPIRIVGIKTYASYCPAGIYKPEDVYIVGSRIRKDGNEKQGHSDEVQKADPAKIEYAAVENTSGKIITCLRNNLTLNERDAKEIRKQFQAPNTNIFKTEKDVLSENIVTGRRRRPMGEDKLKPSDKIRRIIQLENSGFDTSTSDEKLLREAVSTPTPTRKETDKKKLASGSAKSTPCTPVSRREGNNGRTTTGVGDGEESSDMTHHPTLTPGTATSFKQTPTSAKETPKNINKDGAKKTKAKEKGVFDGSQFFLTASGGGDPTLGGPGSTLYDKDEYRDLIESVGGRVFDVVGSEHKGQKYPTYLISDSYARTVKYIYCIAAGIPRLSFAWVDACLRQNEIVEWKPYELEAGYSLEEGRIIPAHRHTPLKDLKIHVTGDTADLYDYWKPVLTAAQANLLKSKKKGPLIPPGTEVLVTDATCPANALAKAVQDKIPCVKPEWLVQTIILGRKAKFDGHEKYRLEMLDQASSTSGSHE